MSGFNPDALILLAHGSPDALWLLPAQATADRIRRLAPDCPVVLAVLEHGPTLAEAVRDLRDAGHRRVVILPLFLSAGGRHVRRDVPAMVLALQQTFKSVALHLVPGALGADETVLDALAEAAVRHARLA